MPLIQRLQTAIVLSISGVFAKNIGKLRQRILSIFEGLRSLLVETMHYGVYGIVKYEQLLAVPSAN